MKQKILWALIFTALALALMAPLSSRAAPPGRVIVGGSFTLQSGETLEEDLIIVGGNVTLEEGSRVEGDIFLLGGRLEVYGQVEGDILAAGGALTLGSSAVIAGDVTLGGGVLNRLSGAIIEGKLNLENDLPLRNTSFDGLWAPLRWWFNSVWNVIWYLGLSFALAALAVLVMMFFERQTENATRTLVQQPAISMGLGCLTLVVLPLAVAILALTICLLPAGLVALLAAGVAIALGWIALGYEVGRRLASLVQRQWAPPFAAGIGTFFLVALAGLLNLIPCIGWVYTTLVSAMGIGAVLLTRFGTQDYVATLSALPSAPQTDAAAGNAEGMSGVDTPQ